MPTYWRLLAHSLLVWAALTLSHASAHLFPYIPTQILSPSACFNQTLCPASSLVYLFSQSSSSEDGVQFLSLDISEPVNESTRLKTVTSDLPFWGPDTSERTALGAARTATGAVYVYSGQCDDALGTIWTFDGKAWTQKPTSVDEKTRGGDASAKGPSFLGGTMAFSAKLAPVMDEPTVYSYGGMCASPSSDSSDWQSAANYTKTMVGLAPTRGNSTGGYSLDLLSDAGPRTGMAGFSITALQPSMSNLSGAVTQQVGYVVLGGQTGQAFINMSTAAVWNLPEESWSYVSVRSPSGLDIDSRSGHTSVLSEDGRSIVVLGGWVGDVNNAADPQLVVLQMGQTYSDWQWVVPARQPQSSGIYGHGAAILPGNVMMVYGGWEVDVGSAPEKRKKKRKNMKKRQAVSTSVVQFLNLTSMSWSSTYVHPRVSKAVSESKGSRLGLGLGLGIGLGLLVIALVVLLFWKTKQRKQKAARDEVIRAMAQDASRFIHDSDDMTEIPWGGGGGGYYSGGQDPWRTGIGSSYGGYAPVVPGILRKPMARQTRGGYVSANAQLASLISPPGQIHPIMEDEEEEREGNIGHQTIVTSGMMTPISESFSDPFQTPTQATASISGALLSTLTFASGSGGIAHCTTATSTSSPDRGARDPDVQDWVEDLGAADALLTRYNNRHGQVRSSPTRRNSHRSVHGRDDDSRTGSNLSESNRSATDSLNRSHSGRWSNIPAAAAAAAASLFGGATTSQQGGGEHGGGGGGSSREPGKPDSSSSSSYDTAKSGFGALQAEGPSLLLGHSSPVEDDSGGREPGSPSKSKFRRSWLGSLKRVFSSADSESTVSDHAQESADMLSGSGYYGSGGGGGGGGDFETPLSGLGGELLRRKQGRQDWEGGEAGGTSTPDNEWDLERAVEQRLVQIMFTVPKERLRVVNAAEDEEGGAAVDDNPKQKQRLIIHEPQTAELVDADRSSIQGSVSSRERGLAATGRASSASTRHGTEEKEGEDEDEEEGGVAMDESLLKVEADERGRRLSRSTMGSLHSSRVLTAEAMTLERPKTRVLRMVDTIEGKSGDASPLPNRASSPTLRSIKSAKSGRSLRSAVGE